MARSLKIRLVPGEDLRQTTHVFGTAVCRAGFPDYGLNTVCDGSVCGDIEPNQQLFRKRLADAVEAVVLKIPEIFFGWFR
jgi:hypothetical protein